MSLPVIIGIFVFLLISIPLVGLGRLPKNKQTTLLKNLFVTTYEFLSNFFLTRGSMHKITRKITMLSIYRAGEIPVQAVYYFLSAAMATLALFAVGIFICKDMITSLLCITFGVIINTVMIEKQADKTHKKVLKDCVKTLSAIEKEYMRSKNIPDALSGADVGKLLRRAIDEIHNILVGSDGELRLQQFYASMPFRPLQTLAGICFNLNYYGDSPDSQNISGFIRAITILRGDVNEQIEKFALQKARFGIMEYMPLIAIIGISPLEGYLTSTIPGVALMYNGALGYILRAVVVLLAIVAYMVISRVNSTVTVKEDDRGTWTIWLLRRKGWRGIISNLLPKDEKTQRKLSIRLKQSLSRMNFEHYYTKKVVFFVLMFAAAIILTVISCILGRDFVRNSTAQLSLVAGTERTVSEQSAMKTMDEIFFEEEGKMDETRHKLLIRTYFPGLSDMQMLDEIKRMKDKYNSWSGIYFRYQYVWIAFAFGLLGCFIPGIMLKVRTFLVKTETEDDYMQLQTLVSILIYTGLDTLSVLQQMVLHSTVHKDILLHAYHSFPSEPEMELERLRSKIALPEFKWFIDKLKLTVSELPMTEAFSDLISERENFIRLRRIAMEATLSKKRTMCSFLAMLPIIAFAIAEFLVPIGVLGFSEFTNALGMLK